MKKEQKEILCGIFFGYLNQGNPFKNRILKKEEF